MEATLALLILFAAIFVFFSQEFLTAFKRIFAIKGAKLVLPLAIGSWLVYSLDMELLWTIIYIKEVLQKILVFLTKLIPIPTYSQSVALIVLLTLLSTLPVYFLDWFFRKHYHKAYGHPYLTSTLILIIAYFLLLV